ncbi:hypothetical protein RIF29_10144 [Crotalaria pallida]|uniref:PH domain-containing protein n=1 Tax=Crotalaria pallida TaxID=3830 RepID=A0AAN9FZY4_CROPI
MVSHPTSEKLAIFTALAFSQKVSGLPPETVFQPLLQDNLVAKGLVLSFVTEFFKEYLIDNSLDDLISILKRGKVEDNLLIFLPSAKRSNEFFSEHFKNEGLSTLVEYNGKKIFDVKLKEMKSALTAQIIEEADIADVIETVKQQIRDSKLPDIEVVRVLWDVLMDVQTIRQGYLSKRSSNLRGDWKRRFFVLDSRGMLYYYRKQHSKSSGSSSQHSGQRNSSEIGSGLISRWLTSHNHGGVHDEKSVAHNTVNLLTSTIKVYADQSDLMFCFRIISPTKNYTLQAESALDQMDWIEKITFVDYVAIECHKQFD